MAKTPFFDVDRSILSYFQIIQIVPYIYWMMFLGADRRFVVVTCEITFISVLGSKNL